MHMYAKQSHIRVWFAVSLLLFQYRCVASWAFLFHVCMCRSLSLSFIHGMPSSPNPFSFVKCGFTWCLMHYACFRFTTEMMKCWFLFCNCIIHVLCRWHCRCRRLLCLCNCFTAYFFCFFYSLHQTRIACTHVLWCMSNSVSASAG